jgi:hypothetical protein
LPEFASSIPKLARKIGFPPGYLQRRFAHRVNFSVMIRLLVRIPFRQRNIREMKLGTNLVKDGEKYVIQFRGEQLKIARRGKLTNKLTFQIEPDGTGFHELLDEWLSIWRPCLLNVHRTYIQTEEGQRVINKIQSQCQDVYHSYQGNLPPDSGRVDPAFAQVTITSRARGHRRSNGYRVSQ